MMINKLKCIGCGAEYAPDTLMNLCPVDGRPVEVIIDLDCLNEDQPKYKQKQEHAPFGIVEL